MPRKKQISNYEPVVTTRPQRNMRAKKVFDPSDNYMPKRKRARTSIKHEKNLPIAKEKEKEPDTKTKVHILNEPLQISIKTEKSDFSPLDSPSSSPVKRLTPEILQETTNICSICTKFAPKKDLVDCPVCIIKVHKECLIVNEPMWKFKLDSCPWLCKQCRKTHCSKCLHGESQSEILRRCITCKVGLHVDCYESENIKPLHPLKADLFVCIPCMTLATVRVPEEEDDEGDYVYSSYSPQSSECDDDLKSNKSYGSSIMSSQNFETVKQFGETNKFDIPNVTLWDKFQLYTYLSDYLPEEIAETIIENEIDGHALLLVKRSDIIERMGLKLGPAMKLYKQVRILQTQSTYHTVFWE